MANDITIAEIQETAERQERNIKFYWAERGYDVKLWNLRIPGDDTKRTAFCTRSDMAGGLPRNWRD